MDREVHNLESYPVIVKLLWFFFKAEIYATVRQGMLYKTSKISVDNRSQFHFKMSKTSTEEQLKIKREEMGLLICEWIKSINPPEVTGSSRAEEINS